MRLVTYNNTDHYKWHKHFCLFPRCVTETFPIFDKNNRTINYGKRNTVVWLGYVWRIKGTYSWAYRLDKPVD